MRPRRRGPLAGEFHDPRFDDDAARPERGIAITTTEHATDARAASNPAAIETTAPRMPRRAAAGKVGGSQNPREKLLSLLAAFGAHAPKPRLEFVVVEHAGHRKMGSEC